MAFSVKKAVIPTLSEIHKSVNKAHYSDCYHFYSDKKNRNALQIWLDQASRIPAWVNFLMDTRNTIVSLFGLKNLGRIDTLDNTKSAEQYQVGDQVGIFTLLFISENEIILGDVDKHLTVKVSIHIDNNNNEDETEGELISFSTVVHVHNLLGKVYMLFVAPIHKIIVPHSIIQAESAK